MQLIEADFKRLVVSKNRAFACIKLGGSVMTWGASHSGGDSTAVKNDFASGVQQIYSTSSGAFAAVENDGCVITWDTDRMV